MPSARPHRHDRGTDPLVRRLVVGLAGTRLSAAEEAWLSRYAPAGVILFRRNIVDARQLQELCGRLHALLPPDGEVVVDHEGGPVAVAENAVGRPPAAWTLGRIDDPELTREVHADTARRLRRLGIDRVLAPVADVLSDPENPVIGARAFGADPDRVAAHVAAAVTGLRDGGIGCCLKHWPGHGGVRVDPHDRPVTVTAPARDELLPFRAGLAAGAGAVMVGHLPVPGRDRPATLLPEVSASIEAVAGRRVVVWADDATMGALRGPLGHLLPEVRRETSGLLPPEDLPREWFARLAEGGARRLAVRGIPWAAFPLDDGPAPPPPDSGPGTGSPPAVDQAASWRRARDLAAGAPWPAATGLLLWWEPFPRHRWAEAVPDLPVLAGWRGEVVRLSGEAAPLRTSAGTGARALLVTSPVPLPGNGEWPPLRAVIDRLADEGRAIVAGHPRLAARVGDVLGEGWEVSALEDCHPWDLAPIWGR